MSKLIKTVIFGANGNNIYDLVGTDLEASYIKAVKMSFQLNKVGDIIIKIFI